MTAIRPSQIKQAGATDGQVLVWNGTAGKWEPGAADALISHAKVLRSASLSLTGSSTWNYIAWDAEEFDTDAYHDTSTNKERLTVPATGVYEIGYAVNSNSTTPGSGRYAGFLLLNGDISTGTKITGGACEFDTASSGQLPNVRATTLASLTAGDWLQVAVLNTFSGSIGVDTDVSAFWIRRVS